MKTPILSLVVPCYNEQEVLPVFYKEAVRVIGEMNLSGPADTEFIFVDDGSNDNTALVIKEMSKSDSRIHYIIF